MLKNSVIRVTGQNWKLVVALLALLIGSFAPLYDGSGIGWTSGTVIASVGYVFALLAIRCPTCGSRWFWQATLQAELYKPLLTQASCPECKHDFRVPPGG